MAKRTETSKEEQKPIAKHTRKSFSIEARQDELIALALDEVEARIRNHEASAMELTQLMKLGTVKAQLEEEELKQKIALDKAKQKALSDADELKELYENALEAMKQYSRSI